MPHSRGAFPKRQFAPACSLYSCTVLDLYKPNRVVMLHRQLGFGTLYKPVLFSAFVPPLFQTLLQILSAPLSEPIPPANALTRFPSHPLVICKYLSPSAAPPIPAFHRLSSPFHFQGGLGPGTRLPDATLSRRRLDKAHSPLPWAFSLSLRLLSLIY